MLIVNYKPSALHGHEDTEPEIFCMSRFWSLRVTWRHRSRDHWTWYMWFAIGGPLVAKKTTKTFCWSLLYI